MKIINKIESILWVIIISFSVFVLTPAFAYLMSESSADNYAKVCVLFINSIKLSLVIVNSSPRLIKRRY